MEVREANARYLASSGTWDISVPVGYKRTEIGVIPEDWVAVRLAEIGEPLIGLTYRPSDVAQDGILVLRSSNVQDGVLRFDDNVFVNCEVPKRIMVQLGDILICVRNGSRNLIGKCALVDERALGMTFGAFMAIFRTDASRFIFQQFGSPLIQRQIREHLGATINQITNASLKSFVSALPPTESEREAIVEVLGDTDALIESLEQLIAKKRQIKQGTMQVLLTGKRRLPGFERPWNEGMLGALGTFLKGRGVARDQAATGDLACIRYGEIYTKHNDYIKVFNSWISQGVASCATRLVHGDLLFAGSGETKEEIGKCVAFVGSEEAYAGGDIVILRSSGNDPKFLGYYLNTAVICARKASKGQGDAVVHIGAEALGSIEIELPELKEQTAIATILTDMDTELAELETRLAKTRQLKQGMMQELLTGRIRLV